MAPRSALPSEIPAASARVIVRGESSNAARFGRIDRSIGRLRCARRSDRPAQPSMSFRASVSSDRSAQDRPCRRLDESHKIEIEHFGDECLKDR
jgi:hypothetical protein